MNSSSAWRQLLPSLPILQWARAYDRDTLVSDCVAALIVTIMLIPQSLAYAMLAGLPPEVGLYASVAPLVLYAVFGTSRVLAVGPVAVVSLMTAVAIGQHALPGTPEYWAVAITLAFLSSLLLLAMGLLRMGFLANFLANHPGLEHVVLQCSAINDIDSSALESLEAIDLRLRGAGLRLHLSEVKGHVMDQLNKTSFLKDLSGRVFLTHYLAIHELSPESTRRR